MKMENLEKEIIKFLTESIPLSIRKTWFLFFFILGGMIFFFKPYIQSLPIRYQIKAIVKTGKIEKRSYKSRILDDLDKVIDNDPMENAVGLSTSDLEILLNGKYRNHRSKMKHMYDTGPFITKIEIPRDSRLILISVESSDVAAGRDTIDIVIKDLKNRFNKEKEIIEDEVRKRLEVLRADHGKMKSQLNRIANISKDVGFSPVLNQQKNDLLIHETKLRYMLIDIEGQLNSDKLSQFRVLSINTSKYPVTMRKFFYYIFLGLFSILLQVFVVLLTALLKHNELPPVLPTKIGALIES